MNPGIPSRIANKSKKPLSFSFICLIESSSINTSRLISWRECCDGKGCVGDEVLKVQVSLGSQRPCRSAANWKRGLGFTWSQRPGRSAANWKLSNKTLLRFFYYLKNVVERTLVLVTVMSRLVNHHPVLVTQARLHKLEVRKSSVE